jgi:hypothetical protein
VLGVVVLAMAIAYGIYYFKNLTSKEEKEENV